MNRRDFLQLSGVIGALVALPVSWAATEAAPEFSPDLHVRETPGVHDVVVGDTICYAGGIYVRTAPGIWKHYTFE